MSKYFLVKTSYNFADERHIDSFCILKKKEYREIGDKLLEYFNDLEEEEELSVEVENGEMLGFRDLSEVVGNEVIEVIPIKKSGYKYYKYHFGKEFGECSLLRVFEAILDEELTTEFAEPEND